MGNEQSGLPDGAAALACSGTNGVPSAPNTPRPILRNSAGGGGGGGGQLGDEKNRRNVVFRDQTEDALRLNHSIVRGSAGGGDLHAQFAAGGSGLTRLSQQVNDINGGLRRQAVPESLQANGQAKRPVRIQKPPAPAPPPVEPDQQELGEKPAEAPPETEAAAVDSRLSRMREHVFALAEKKEKRNREDEESSEGRLFDPSVQELPTVAEETEERDDTRQRGLSKADSTEALREQIKQEILHDLLSHPSSTSGQSHQQAAAEGAVSGDKINDVEKNKLISEIRNQLLGQKQSQEPADYLDGSIPEPDYSEDELTQTSELPPRQLTRFASELEIRAAGTGNGHYRSPLQPRRIKGPAPAPPNARYRRSGGPPVVREPYQAQWEEPIFAYDGPQKAEQGLQEQMEKAYDDRYRQKSRSKRFGDSWKRMTASLSKTFGFNNSADGGGGRGGGGGGKSGVARRSSVRDSTFERPADSRSHQRQQQQQQQHQQQQQQHGFRGSRASSVYSLAGAEMPPVESENRLPQQLQQPHLQRAPLSAEIWRDAALTSNNQMLHTSNPVFGFQAMSGSAAAASTETVTGQSESAIGQKSPIARVTVKPLNNKVNTDGEQTHL